MTPLRSLLRVMRQGDGDLLSLVPEAAYRLPMTPLGYSRRSILLINDPELARDVLTDPLQIFPKNDLMVGALAPLVGDSIFVSSGAAWRRQREMVDPAFSHMRINHAFSAMQAGIDAYCDKLDAVAASQAPISLDFAMSELTADIICRTIFSTSLDGQTARDVFDAFAVFEASVANVNLWQLIFAKPWSDVRQPAEVLAACEKIRSSIGTLLAPRIAAGADDTHDDIASAIIAARDPATGEGFTEKELIDQIGVFFLAGHETTASVLTWVFYILSQAPSVAAMLREEVDTATDGGPVTFGAVKKLTRIRSVFRETLRLYPPITFIPRVAAQSTTIGGVAVKKGAMLMISPWTAHRNAGLWRDAAQFDPLRFHADNESDADKGAFMSFGLGPRVCVGAAFATIESALIIAEIVRRYDFIVKEPALVRPVARLTTRPAEEIQCTVQRRALP